MYLEYGTDPIFNLISWFLILINRCVILVRYIPVKTDFFSTTLQRNRKCYDHQRCFRNNIEFELLIIKKYECKDNTYVRR